MKKILTSLLDKHLKSKFQMVEDVKIVEIGAGELKFYNIVIFVTYMIDFTMQMEIRNYVRQIVDSVGVEEKTAYNVQFRVGDSIS